MLTSRMGKHCEMDTFFIPKGTASHKMNQCPNLLTKFKSFFGIKPERLVEIEPNIAEILHYVQIDISWILIRFLIIYLWSQVILSKIINFDSVSAILLLSWNQVVH